MRFSFSSELTLPSTTIHFPVMRVSLESIIIHMPTLLLKPCANYLVNAGFDFEPVY